MGYSPTTMLPRRLRTAPLAIWLLLGCDVGPTDPEPLVMLGRRLMVGENAACALDRQGAVHCWGANTDFLEYGVSALDITSQRTPVAVPVPPLTSFANGVGTHFCGLKDATALCWARGGFGQLGRGTVGATGNAAAPVAGGQRWREISVSRLSTCGIAEDDTAYCWGTNQRGEIGVDTVPLRSLTLAPRAVLNGDFRFRHIAAGWLHACGITTDGQTFCWGDNVVGQLGNGTADTLPRRIPTLVAGGHAFTRLALSAKHSCGIAADGFTYCWGNNQFGQLGDGTTTDRHVPTRVAGNVAFTDIVAGSGFAGFSDAVVPVPRTAGGVAHTCALTAGGAAWCWGWNGNGQLGDGSVTDRHTPVAVAGGLTFDAIGAAGSYTCGMRDDAIWCWGTNLTGQLGNNAAAAASTPVRVGPPFDKP